MNLKVSLIVSDLSSQGAGRWGGGIRSFMIGEALQRLGYQVEIFGVAFGEVAKISIDPKIKIIAFGCKYHSGFFRAASQLIKKIDGDIIYAAKLKPSSLGIGLVKKFLTHRPLILDIDDWEMSWHGGDRFNYRFSFQDLKPNGALRYPDHPLYLQWSEKLLTQVDLITTNSKFLQQRFGGVYLPSGKDTTVFNPAKYDYQASKKKYGLTAYQVLMFPGAPRPYKGVEDVLMALEKLNKPQLKLIIVGGSPYDDYDSQLRKKWGKWLIQLPPANQSQMPEIIAAADIIVVPQRNTFTTQAQFPLKLTDGMAMAKPILATKVGDIPEILNDTGFLVAPDSPDEICQSLEFILSHPQPAQSRGLAARERCLHYYSIESMMEILQNNFSRI